MHFSFVTVSTTPKKREPFLAIVCDTRTDCVITFTFTVHSHFAYRMLSKHIT